MDTSVLYFVSKMVTAAATMSLTCPVAMSSDESVGFLLALSHRIEYKRPCIASTFF